MGKISFVVKRDGTVSLEVFGAKGMECEEITRAFEEALGTKTNISFKEEDYVVLDGVEQHVGTGE